MLEETSLVLEETSLLNEVLIRFDESQTSFAEHNVSEAIRRFLSEQKADPIPVSWLAEAMAFDFCENYQDKETGWGTYYGPMIVWNNEDGIGVESPSIR